MRVIKQVVKFKVEPSEVYETLMNSEKHSKFTGTEAKISKRVGGKFLAYDRWIEGENLELIENKKIVQKWRADDWPKGHYSIVTFELRKIREGTELIFTQTDVPDEFYEDVSEGWEEYYWKKMAEYFENNN